MGLKEKLFSKFMVYHLMTKIKHILPFFVRYF